jgi:CRP-like cAMP-binding protein
MTSEVLELDQKTFELILTDYPSVRAAIFETAVTRRARLSEAP